MSSHQLGGIQGERVLTSLWSVFYECSGTFPDYELSFEIIQRHQRFSEKVNQI